MDVPNGYDDVCDDANHNPHEISTQIVDETVDDTSEVVESTLMNEVETRSEVDSNGFVEVESAIVEYDSDTMTEGESNDSDSDSRRNRDVMRSDMTILDTITGGSDECELSVNQYPSAQDLDADLACMPPADNQNLETNERSTHLQELQQFLDYPVNDLCYPHRRPYYPLYQHPPPYPLYDDLASYSCRVVACNSTEANIRTHATRFFLVVTGIGSLLLLRSFGAMYALIAECCSSLLFEVISLTILLALFLLSRP